MDKKKQGVRIKNENTYKEYYYLQLKVPGNMHHSLDITTYNI